MAILVMRLSGSHFGTYFMPCAAGVGYSYSPYRFLPELSPEAGMLRLVMGLGTAAVDRIEGTYPRLVSLDRPESTPHTTSARRHRFSQRKISVIDTAKAAFCYVSSETLEDRVPFWLKNLLYEHDTEAEQVFYERGESRSIVFVSCLGLARKTDLMQFMQQMIQQLQFSYSRQVDIEFTINVSDDGDFVVNLLQCRPLLVMQDQKTAGDEDLFTPEEDASVLLETRNASMGKSRSGTIDGIVLIDPVAYYELPYKDKPQIARSLGQLNWYFRETDHRLLLLIPGRVGTSSPELGVPTAFSDISSFSVICEVAESRAGYQPELSYGSHIFQDLVEAEILYASVFEDSRTLHFHPELLSLLPNRIKEIVPDAEESVIQYYDTSRLNCRLRHDMSKEHLLLSLCLPESTNP